MGGFNQLSTLAGGASPDLFQPPVPQNQQLEFLKKARRAQGLPDLPDWLMNNMLMNYLGQNFGQVVQGGQQMFGPQGTTLDQRAQGLSDVVRGGLPFLAPLAGPAMVEAPVGALLGLGVGSAAGAGTEELAKKAGLPPGLSSLAGDVVGLGAGGAAANEENLMAAGRAWDRLNAGSDERGSISRKPKPPVIRDLGDLMDTPLTLKGEGLTHDLGAALDKSIKSRDRMPRFGKGADPEQYRPRALEMMMRDVQWGLKHMGESRDWYTKMVQDMENQLAEHHVDFQDPHNRALFKYLLGITSNGVDPETNFAAALKGWDMRRSGGKFSAYDPNEPSPFGNPKGLGLTFRANSYEGAINRLNQLIDDQGGVQQAVEWLKTKHPVSELRKYYDDVPGKASDERYGSYIFGEKVGAFGSNLNGIHTELTADKWWSRTWNRWMGTVMATDAEGRPKLNKETGLPELQDAPRNEGERNLMRETAAKVASDLGLNVDELQAVLWYTEQALYRAHGLEAGSIGYDEAARNHLARRGVQPKSDGGNRPPPAGGRANANARAPQRGNAKTPPGVSGRRQEGPQPGQ